MSKAPWPIQDSHKIPLYLIIFLFGPVSSDALALSPNPGISFRMISAILALVSLPYTLNREDAEVAEFG